MFVILPTYVVGIGFVKGFCDIARGHSDVMLEAVLAQVGKQLLQVRSVHPGALTKVASTAGKVSFAQAVYVRSGRGEGLAGVDEYFKGLVDAFALADDDGYLTDAIPKPGGVAGGLNIQKGKAGVEKIEHEKIG